MNNLEYIESKIKESLDDAIVKVIDLTGTADHLSVLIASDYFDGKILIDQHQIIMDLFKDELKSNRIHALQLKTMTLEKYQKLK